MGSSWFEDQHIYSLPNGFASRSWLTDGNHSLHIASVIDATVWLLWKSRCDVIFRNASVNFSVIICKALTHEQEYTNCNKGLLDQKLILNNFSYSDELLLFSHASINQCSKVRSVGFFISNTDYAVNLAGCCAQAMVDSSLDDLFALGVALQTALDK